ncbi:MAG: hypothetical protein ACYDIC_07250 [Desulfobaccales bacterium]
MNLNGLPGNDPVHGHWVECPDVPGFRILLLWPDHSSFLKNWFHKIDWSEGRTAVKHNAQVCRDLLKVAIKNFQGLTVAALKRLCPEVAIKGEDAQEIPFSMEHLEIILLFSSNIYLWLEQLWVEQLVFWNISGWKNSRYS